MAAKKTKIQGEIPGTERETIAELDQCSVIYNDAKLARVAASAEETTAAKALEEAMRRHKRKNYVNHKASPPIICTLVEGKTKVATKQEKGDDGKPKKKNGPRDATLSDE